MTSSTAAARRPDLMALASPEYDLDAASGPQKTLIICSAPRTGSYEFCRFLLAAGVGVPHEYFHPQFAQIMGSRWGVAGAPLNRGNIDLYVAFLRRRRARNGILTVNMQYWQYTEHLVNPAGAQLFNGAVFVHLFRPDIVGQITSWRIAMNTGVWDFSGRQTSDPREYPESIEERIAQFESDMKFISGEDAGFRELFTFLDVLPIFLTTPELFRKPRDIVCDIARLLGVDPNIPALDEMIASSKPYAPDRAAREKAYGELASHLKRRAFGF
jgi:LPS sulfotransferase NodH